MTYTVSQVAALKRIYTGGPGTMTASQPTTLTLAQWIANVGARHPKATAAAILSTAKSDYAKQQAGLAAQAPVTSGAPTVAGAAPTLPDSTTLPGVGSDATVAPVGTAATGTAAPVSTVPTSSAAVGTTLPDLSSLLGTTTAAPATTSSSSSGLSITDLAIIGGTLIALIVAVRTKGKAK